MIYSSRDRVYSEFPARAPSDKMSEMSIVIELGKKPENAVALAAANTHVAGFEDAATRVYN